MRTHCTRGHSRRTAPKKCGFYPRAMRRLKANRNWEQRPPKAHAMQSPFVQNWKRAFSISSWKLAKTIQMREAKTQGQRPLAAPKEGPVGSVLPTANLCIPFLALLSFFAPCFPVYKCFLEKKLKKGKITVRPQLNIFQPPSGLWVWSTPVPKGSYLTAVQMPLTSGSPRTPGG